MEKKFRFNIIYVIVASILVLIFQQWLTEYQTVERIPYSKFLTLVDENGVTDVVIRETTVTGSLKEPIDGHEKFVTKRVERVVYLD